MKFLLEFLKFVQVQKNFSGYCFSILMFQSQLKCQNLMALNFNKKQTPNKLLNFFSYNSIDSKKSNTNFVLSIQEPILKTLDDQVRFVLGEFINQGKV